MVTNAQNTEALNALLFRADYRRASRAEDRPVRNPSWSHDMWTGECVGSNGETHYFRINLAEGRRAFNCTCKDRERAHEVGPCKHVIALARVGLQHIWMLDLFDVGSSPVVAA